MLYTDLLVNDITEKAQEFLHQFMLGIRQHSRYRVVSPSTNINQEFAYGDNLHNEEIRFLTVLHSRNWRRVHQYWPLNPMDEAMESGEGCLKFASFNKMNDPYGKSRLLKFNGKKGKWHEHEFKFRSIQSWIRTWAGIDEHDHPLNPNIAHNLIIGASVMLESTFAKMRSHILKEKKVGSIVIDGGGRISFLSTTNDEDERNNFNEQLKNILILEKGHPHPYHDVIETAMNEYIGFETVRSFLENQTNTTDFYEVKSGKYKLKSKGFLHLFRSDYMASILPEISGIEEDSNPIDYAKRINQSDEAKACIFCQKAGPSEQTGEQVHPRDSLSQWLEDSYVCPIHHLLFEIGEAAQIRMGSRYDLHNSAPTMFKTGEKTVQQMVLFDGNSIGGWFMMPFNNYQNPQFTRRDDEQNQPHYNMPFWEDNSDNILANWEQKKEMLLDLRKTVEEPLIDNFDPTFPEEWVERLRVEVLQHKGMNFVEELMFRRRMQAMIRRQRRSFHFNATWWTTLKDGLNHMIPWVLAGDDLVLVNSKRLEDQEILDVLGKLHNLLSKNFPHTPLTFAGALLTRGESTIQDMYRKASDLEDEAGYLWKFLVAENEKLPSLSDKKEQKKKAWLNKKTEVGKNLPRLIQNINLFKVGEEGSVPSIILQKDWYQDLPKTEEEEE